MNLKAGPRQMRRGSRHVPETGRMEEKMKSTGITRQVDELGRFVLPIEIRRALDIKVRDSLEIFTDEGRIILQKYVPACFFCSNADGLVNFENKRICRECLEKIKKLG